MRVMTPLPAPLGTSELYGWRVDRAEHAAGWASGAGAGIEGGRWNTAGTKAVYLSIDPGTALLEVAAHKRFALLDTRPHVLTALKVDDPGQVRVVRPSEVPNPNWLVPGTPSHGQMAWGDALLAAHAFVLLPSVVSSHSWNLLLSPALAAGRYTQVLQEPLAIDTRLHPPPAPGRAVR